MKTIAIDIRHSVFENESEGIMYVIKDVYAEPTQYIFAIPVITFSWNVESEKDLETFFPHSVFGDKEKEKRLLEEMRKAINEF